MLRSVLGNYNMYVPTGPNRQSMFRGGASHSVVLAITYVQAWWARAGMNTPIGQTGLAVTISSAIFFGLITGGCEKKGKTILLILLFAPLAPQVQS